MKTAEYITKETFYPLATKQEIVGNLIRCRKCKWWSGEEYRECRSPNWDTGTGEYFITPAGFYCGWAERKEK